MIRLYQGNAWTQFVGVPPHIHREMVRRLSIPLVTPADKRQARFGSSFWRTLDDGSHQAYGSLVHEGRVPAGLTWHVTMICKHHGAEYELSDNRVRPDDGLPMWMIEAPGAGWRDYQDAVHAKIIQHGMGVIDAPPRSGKTAMAMRAIDALGLKAIYVAPSIAIVNQTYERMLETFGDEHVGRCGGNQPPDIDKHIVVSTAPSAAKLTAEWYAERGILIIDEFHHGAANTYHTINSLAEGIFHRLMFTGTHFRTADDVLAMHAVCSQVLHRIEVPDLIAAGFLAPPEVRFVPVATGCAGATDWPSAYDLGIVNNDVRNEKIVEIVGQNVACGEPTIVLVNRRAHAAHLGELIPESKVVMGGEGALTSKAIDDFKRGSCAVLIGTSVIGEGVDVPTASVLVYACGGGASVSMMQSYFRPMTAHAGKSRAIIYDFFDKQHRILERQSLKRFEFAQSHLGNCVGLV